MRKELIWAVFAVMLLAAIPVKAAPDPGLVGLWHFDTVDTTVSPYATPDNSGQSNTGYLYPVPPSFGPTLTSGKFGKALSFGGDDYVQVGHSTSMDVSNSYTFEAWVYLDDESDYRGIFRRGTPGVAASEIEIYTWPGPPTIYDRRLVVVHNREGAFCYRYFTPFPLDQWVHLAVTWVGTTSKAYYNGVMQTSVGGTAMVNPATSDKPSFIGLGYYKAFTDGNTPYMVGLIDEVRLWNETLTAAQIQQSYALGAETEATVELGEQFLADGGVAIFTSAFYWPGETGYTFPVTLEARVMIVGSTATVDDSFTERKITPRGSVNYIVDTTPVWGLDVTVSSFDGGAKSLHLTMVLSTGEGLGFNIQNLPYD